IGLVAALATIRKHREHQVHEHLIDIGKQVKQSWKKAASIAKLDIVVSGIDPLGNFSFQYEDSRQMRTYFAQRMLDHGIMAKNAFYASFAHTDAHVERYASIVEKVFLEIASCHENNNWSSVLKGDLVHEGFQRLA
ncbi:MAG: aminotransferase class III, partial [Phototrophicales bacterium]